MNFDRGTVVLVGFDPTVGHEQQGLRPCIAASDPAVNTDQSFALIAVVPVTGKFVNSVTVTVFPADHWAITVEFPQYSYCHRNSGPQSIAMVDPQGGVGSA